MTDHLMLRGTGLLKLDDLRVVIQDGSVDDVRYDGIDVPLRTSRVVLGLTGEDGVRRDLVAEDGTLIRTGSSTWRVGEPVIEGPFEHWLVLFDRVGDASGGKA